MNMKKYCLLILLVLFFAPSAYASASSLQERIESETLKTFGVVDESKMSREETVRYTTFVQKVKEDYYKENPEELKHFKAFSPKHKSRDNLLLKGDGGCNECGDILISLDQHTSIFGYDYYHGHAGICGFYYGNTIEANPRKGVTDYTDNYIERYWRKSSTGGRYEVYGAVRRHYVGVRNYAMDKIGTPYGFLPGQEYCSGLVWRAWASQGIKLTGGITVVTPSQIMNSDKTYRVEKFTGSGVPW